MAKKRKGEDKPVELAVVLAALADPVRLKIVRMAGKKELACCAFEMPLSKATMSHHFRILREAGIIRQRPSGAQRLTSLLREELDRRFPGFMKIVLRAEAKSSKS